MSNELTYKLKVDSSEGVRAINEFFGAVEQGAAQAKSKLNTALGESVQKEVKIEFKNGKLVAKEIESINSKSNKLRDIQRAINGELGRTPNQLKRQSSILKQLLGDTQKFKRGTKELTAEWQRLSQRMKEVSSAQKTMGQGSGGWLESLTSGLTGSITKAQLAVQAFNAFKQAVINTARFLVETGTKMEFLMLQLEAFTGSTEGAKDAFASFKATASQSPFTLEQVSQAGKTLLAFGLDIEQVKRSMEDLAMIAGATGGDLNNLARNLGQISAQGRAFTRDLTQFAIQGIPIWEQLSAVTGKSVVELKKMAQEGTIGFKEVNAALESMTAKGSAFARVAEDMKTTWYGLGQALQTELQDIARNWVDLFNNVDEGMGGLAKGSLALVVNVLGGINNALGLAQRSFKNLGNTVMQFINPAVALFSKLGGSFASIQKDAEWLVNTLRGFFGIAPEIGRSAEAAAQLNQETSQLSPELQKLKESMPYTMLVEKSKEAAEKAGELNKEWKVGQAELERLGEIADQAFARQIESVQGLIEKDRERMETERENAKLAEEAIKASFQVRKSALEEEIRLVQQRYDEELARLDQLSPAQQRLNQLRRQELQAKANDGSLSEKERLTAQVALENMDKQIERKRILRERDAELKRLGEEKVRVQQEEKKALEEHRAEHKATMDEIKAGLKAHQAELKKLQKDRDDLRKKIDDAGKSQDDLNVSIGTATNAVNTQIGVVYNLRDAYSAAADEAERLAAAAAAGDGPSSGGGESSGSGGGSGSGSSGGSSGSGTAGGLFTGGPTMGGSAYTVNELGQEAFLSAAGRLSMINAPAFGKWRAPGAGTVIPAHLTKLLDVPSGGVDLNKGASAQASRAAGGGSVASAMKSIRGALGSGDRITNNVTIQASNTVQAASDMMVQLNKIRRRRMG